MNNVLIGFAGSILEHDKRRYISPLVTRVSGSSGPEGPPDVVSLPGIPDDGEVAHSALLAPEAGIALVDSSERRGEDPSAGIEEV